MDTAHEAALSTQVDLGCLFGEVHASVVFGTHIGAHVTIDGNYIEESDRGLVALPFGLDLLEVQIRVRRIALDAVARAHAAIGAEFGDADRDLARQTIARALPLSWPQD